MLFKAHIFHWVDTYSFISLHDWFHIQAYRKVAGKSKLLPGLTDYTNDQLFFIAFGQVYIADINL